MAESPSCVDREKTLLGGEIEASAVVGLEKEHIVHVSFQAVCTTADLTYDHFSQTFSGQELVEKGIDILNSACLVARDEFNSQADEKMIDEWEYSLSRCMLESTELLRENPKCKLWLPRVDKEYKRVTARLNFFIKDLIPIWEKSLGKAAQILRSRIEDLCLKRLAALPACIHSACRTGDFSDCYHKLQFLDASAAKVERILLTRSVLQKAMRVDPHHVAEAVSRLVDIPVPRLPYFGSPELTLLGHTLSARVVDQDDAITAIYRSLFNITGYHPDHLKRPRCSWIFLGPSGVGKSEVVKCFAEVFFGSQDRLIQVDMSKFGEPSTGPNHQKFGFQWLFEAINKRPNHQESGFQWLFEAINKKPHSLILFDNIEKSHLNTTMETLLLDITSGNLNDNNGRHVNLSQTIVIMTYSSKQTDADLVLEEGRTVFSPTLLNSVDRTVVFDAFGHGIQNLTRHIMRVKAREISGDKLIVYLSNHVLDVVSNNYSKQPDKAVKEVKSWLEENVMPSLRGIVEDMADKHCAVYIDTFMGTEELSFRVEKTNFSEEWMYKHFDKLSFREFRNFYQKKKALVDGILQLRKCLGAFFSPKNDCKSKGDKHFVDTAAHVLGICYKILQSVWPLDVDTPEKEKYLNSTILFSYCKKEASEGLQNLKARLLLQKETVQNQAVKFILNTLLNSLELSQLDHDSEKSCPQSFLFMGLPSLCRKQLVKILDGQFKVAGEKKSLLIQVDLSDYDQNPQSQLFSSSQGGATFASWILEAVSSCPHSILLFHTIEKANASAFGTLLKILDTGMLYDDDRGSMVDFRSTTLIVTTELGNKDMMAKCFGGSNNPYSCNKIDSRKGLKHFRSELVYRMDEIVFVNPLSRKEMNIIRLPLKEGALLKEDLKGVREFLYHLFGDSSYDLTQHIVQWTEKGNGRLLI